MSKPVRLAKKEEYSFNESLELCLMRYAPVILVMLIIILVLLIGAVIVVMVGSGNMTMTESNNYFYHMKDVI